MSISFFSPNPLPDLIWFLLEVIAWQRIGDEVKRLMHLVPAPAVRLMKRRVFSRPGLNSPKSRNKKLNRKDKLLFQPHAPIQPSTGSRLFS